MKPLCAAFFLIAAFANRIPTELGYAATFAYDPERGDGRAVKSITATLPKPDFLAKKQNAPTAARDEMARALNQAVQQMWKDVATSVAMVGSEELPNGENAEANGKLVQFTQAVQDMYNAYEEAVRERVNMAFEKKRDINDMVFEASEVVARNAGQVKNVLRDRIMEEGDHFIVPQAMRLPPSNAGALESENTPVKPATYSFQIDTTWSKPPTPNMQAVGANLRETLTQAMNAAKAPLKQLLNEPTGDMEGARATEAVMGAAMTSFAERVGLTDDEERQLIAEYLRQDLDFASRALNTDPSDFAEFERPVSAERVETAAREDRLASNPANVLNKLQKALSGIQDRGYY